MIANAINFFRLMFRRSQKMTALGNALARIKLLERQCELADEAYAERYSDHAAEITRLSESNKHKESVIAGCRRTIAEQHDQIEQLISRLGVVKSHIGELSSTIESYVKKLESGPGAT